MTYAQVIIAIYILSNTQAICMAFLRSTEGQTRITEIVFLVNILELKKVLMELNVSVMMVRPCRKNNRSMRTMMLRNDTWT
jgi:hypothetical protein